jgi:mono/diheme cytochrome c family protein
MSAYSVTLFAHSYLRWIVLGLAAVVLVRAFIGWRRARAWAQLDERLHSAFVGSVDTQLLVGLLLYVALSPISKAFFADPGRGMKDTILRFYGMEHAAMMIAAVAVVHIGRARSKKAATPELRQRRVWTTTLAALVLMLAAVPWPSLRHGRPLLRGATASAPAPIEPAAPSCPPAYAARCATCHGETGRGDGVAAQGLRPPPRSFADAQWAGARTDAQLRAVIRDGGAAHGLSPMMLPHRDLSDAELDALVTCVRSLGRAPGP